MNLLLQKSRKKTATKSQSAFNRLIKKIEKLQKTITQTEAALNEGLRYYHSDIRPIEEKMIKKLLVCIPLFYSYYNHPRSKLTKNESEILKELIQSLIHHLTRYVMPQQVNPEIIEIINEIEGINVQEIMKEEIEILKNEMFAFAAESGLNIDLSTISISDSETDLMAKLQKAIFEASRNQKPEEIDKNEKQEKPKTKQQLNKEQHLREVEEIQKKGLSKIYKQLAKTLHPDLELDPILKAEKEELMKQLTTAYENQDLHTLLSLEITWMNRTASNENHNYSQQTEEQLKVYNGILKDQVDSLQEELRHLFLHPRYFDMLHILERYGDRNIYTALQDEEAALCSHINRFSSAISELNDGSNFKRVKQILKEFSEPDLDIVAQIMRKLQKNSMNQ